MIQWLLQSVHDIDERPELFLSAAELARFDSFYFEKRRGDWLIGRWTAKCLLQAVLLQEHQKHVPRAALEIFNSQDGAPHGRINGQTVPMHLSISHSHGAALCAIDTEPVGADLEWIELREPAFTTDFFTANEQEHINASPLAHRDMVITGYWSAKEAVLKAMHLGLSLDTRAIEIYGDPSAQAVDRWLPYGIGVHLEHAVPLRGWWRIHENLILTLATSSHDLPAAVQTLPHDRESLVGVENDQGHGVFSRRIAESTRHHARHTHRN